MIVSNTHGVRFQRARHTYQTQLISHMCTADSRVSEQAKKGYDRPFYSTLARYLKRESARHAIYQSLSQRNGMEIAFMNGRPRREIQYQL